MLFDILGLVIYAILLVAFLVVPVILGRAAENLLYSLKNIFWNWVERSRKNK